MAEITAERRIRGWYFFDWASQPYNTLLLTFIFGPYFASVVTAQLVAAGLPVDLAKAQAQAYWGYGLTVSGLAIALLAPVLGAFADNSGRRMPWVWVFSVFYVVGAAALWFTAPQEFSIVRTLFFFGLGLIGMEFATIFTNAMLPGLGDSREIGRISGSGWAFGYVGGVLSLAVMLALFQAGDDGRTMAGIEPLFGLDTATREDTRIVGPLTAAWYALFMIPFFVWVREPHDPLHVRRGTGRALSDLARTLRRLPDRPSLLSFLASSMFYRDALNGMYTFGGIYAFGVLGWSITQVGIFGIFAAVTGAIFAWIGGRADRRFGPRPVILVAILALLVTAITIVMLSRESVYGIPFAPGSAMPDLIFLLCGGMIGAAGGALQSASRTMMVRQSNPARMTEAFGLYALSGKATAFLAPASIALVSDISGSQRAGIIPLVLLFLIGLVLLRWVKPQGDAAEWARFSPPLRS